MNLSKESRVVLELIRSTENLEEALFMLQATGLEIRKYSAHYAAGRWEDQSWGAYLSESWVEVFFESDGLVQCKTIPYDGLEKWSEHP